MGNRTVERTSTDIFSFFNWNKPYISTLFTRAMGSGQIGKCIAPSSPLSDIILVTPPPKDRCPSTSNVEAEHLSTAILKAQRTGNAVEALIRGQASIFIECLREEKLE